MKLLPSATNSAIIKPRSSVISTNKLVPTFSDKKAEDKEKTTVIKEKLTTIAGLLEGTLASKKKEENDKRKEEQQERRSKREAKLEKKPKDTGGKLDLPKVPGMSFLDRIKQFLMNVLGGYLLYRLVEFAPLLKPVFVGLVGIGEWLINFGGKILNGLVTFIDWGYKAYDWTRKQVENIFGEDAAKGFDSIASNLTTLLNGAVIAAMTAIKVAEGVNKQVARTAAAGGKVAAGVAARGAGRTITRTALRVGGRKLARTAAVKGTQSLVSGAVSIIKPLVKRVPIIGGIIEFVLSMIAGDPVGKAAFRGVGSGLGMWLGGALGTILGPGIGTWIGSALGGAAGAELGGLLYDTIFKEKEPQPAEIQGRQEGGQIRPLDTPNQRVVKPNYAKGIQQVSQVKTVEDKSKFAGPTKAFSQIDYFGPVLATATKVLAGDDPSQSDYKSIGAGFNNLLLKGFQDEKLKSNLAIAYKDGGIVSADSLKDSSVASSNFAEWVGNTFKGLFAKNKASIEESKKETKKETKKEPRTLEGMLKQAIESISGISPQVMDSESTYGSTYGPGSVPTERDTATGVPLTSAGQATGAIQPDSDIVTSMGFSAEDWELFRNTVAQIESGGKYDIAGGSGGHYDGRYQLGAAAKTDGARYAGVTDPGHSPAAREAFRKNSELQEKIFAGFTKANHTYLMGVPEYRDANPQRKLQILGYAHNQGMGGAANWMKTGVVGADGFGTKGTKYTDSIAAEFRKRAQKMQFGGKVTGQEGIDKVPAMLTSGEFVIDKDSTMAIQTAFPGFLSAINKAEGKKAVEILMNYASYNDPTAGEVVVIDRKEVIAQAPMESVSSAPSAPSSTSINFKEILSFVG